MALEVGEKAPGFAVPIADGESIGSFRLEDNLGKGAIILAFFPLAFSPGCTGELCGFRDQWSQFQALDSRIYGISVDSPFALNAFVREHGLPFPLLSDFNREVSRSFGVLHEELQGLRAISKRSVFVLDHEGVIRYRWVSDDPSAMPEHEEIRQALRSLRK